MIIPAIDFLLLFFKSAITECLRSTLQTISTAINNNG